VSLAPANYANLPGRSVRLALNVIRGTPGCLECQTVRGRLMALSCIAETRQAAIYTKRGTFVRMRRATAEDYAVRVDGVVEAVRAWRRSLGMADA
jgi:hypothetical protein